MRIDSSDRDFVKELIRLVETKEIEYIIPAGHEGTFHVSFLKHQLSRCSTVLVEDYEKVMRLHDKGETLHLARRLGIPVPATFFPSDAKEAEDYAAGCSYPVVVKARKGAGADGVWYAQNREDLLRMYTHARGKGPSCDGIIRDTSSPMFQEYVSGDLEDVAVFCLNGGVAAALTQKRLLTKPLSGGKGIVNVTTRDEELLDYAGRVAMETHWNGVLLFDFKRDARDGKPRLLEVNPRFWGTTWLTTCAGLNFPHNLVLAAKKQPLRFPDEYPLGLVCRWPLYELGTFLESPRSISSFAARLNGFFQRFRWKDCVSDFVWRDPKPLVAEFVALFIRMWRDLVRKRRAR
jgi:predicted ATP-grasp superfamily ATP-dependent carboligase